MIDIHCHILPDIDDGAVDMDTAVRMARQAVQEGIHTIIATPHHDNGKFYTPAAQIQKAVIDFQAELRRLDIPLTILPGQEVRVTNQTVDEWEKGRLQPLADSRYLLIELPSVEVPRRFDDWLHEIYVAGYQPVLAHPERNAELIAHPERLIDWVNDGMVTQVTSHTLTGLFGKKLQQFAKQLVEANAIHCIATDAHDDVRRPIAMQQAMRLIEREYGTEVVAAWRENAKNIVENSELKRFHSIWKKKKWFQFW